MTEPAVHEGLIRYATLIGIAQQLLEALGADAKPVVIDPLRELDDGAELVAAARFGPTVLERTGEFLAWRAAAISAYSAWRPLHAALRTTAHLIGAHADPRVSAMAEPLAQALEEAIRDGGLPTLTRESSAEPGG